MSYNRILNNKLVKRAEDLSLTDPVQSLYQQTLFDLDSSDSLISLYNLNSTHPIWDIINVSNTNTYTRKENFLVYAGADGIADDNPTADTITDPCDDGNTFEYGVCSWEVSGFNRIRRTTPVRDITRRNMVLTDRHPVFDIAGNRINNDFEWDVAMLSTTVLQGMHRQLMGGTAGGSGEVSGILELIASGYANPQTEDDCAEMDSYVVDWADQIICDFSAGNTSASVNGNTVDATVGANLTMIDLIKAYVQRVAQKISVSSVSGDYRFISMLDIVLLQDLIDCYVCYTVCGRDITRMESVEARVRNEELRSQLGEFGAVTLSFDGYNVTFIPWQYSDDLYDSVNDDYTMVFIVPRIGNYPVWEIEFLDMENAIDGMDIDVQSEFMVTDNGRWLHMEDTDKTCYKRHLETQFRVLHRAPWTSMKITNIKSLGNPLGRISLDPQSPDYLGGATKTLASEVSPI